MRPVAGRCALHDQSVNLGSFDTAAAAAASPADVTLTRLLVSVSLSVATTLASYAPADLLSLLSLATHALPFASVTAGSTPTVHVTLTTATWVPAAASAECEAAQRGVLCAVRREPLGSEVEVRIAPGRDEQVRHLLGLGLGLGFGCEGRSPTC